MTPIKISVLEKKYLSVSWNDGMETKIKLANLRKKCPCAICNSEKKENGDKYIPIYTNDQLTISEISKVGKYAIAVYWKDGHNTGIYEFGYLRNITDLTGDGK
ncbi:MAG: DUF971 domain-containing protein [Bacteroidetes bacterium]|nr:DUF971 domain-containing protein [Bacteroidota bacterium]